MNIKTNMSGVGLVFGTFEGHKISHISVEELEKFAELIVRGCVEIVETEAAQYAAPVWAVELINDMHEQFGMERHQLDGEALIKIDSQMKYGKLTMGN